MRPRGVTLIFALTSARRASAAALVAALAGVVSCGTSAPPAASSPSPVPASPPLSQITVSTRCFGPLRTGTYSGLACVAEVSETGAPRPTTYGVQGDLRIFGGPAELRFPKCPACGGPPWTFDIDLRIPADMAPGVKTFPVWATDADGRRADTTASIEIVAR